MHEHESLARDLHARLQTQLAGTGIEPDLDGEGGHWGVSTRYRNRVCEVRCFHYGDMIGKLMLGMRGNAHLSKVYVGVDGEQRRGPEYYLELNLNSELQATGRTPAAEEAIRVLIDWLVFAHDLERVYADHSFLDDTRRALEQMVRSVNSELLGLGSNCRAVLEEGDWGREGCQVWLYANERSCCLAEGTGNSIARALLLHRAQLARGDGLDVKQAAEVLVRWLDQRETTTNIHEEFPGVEPD